MIKLAAQSMTLYWLGCGLLGGVLAVEEMQRKPVYRDSNACFDTGFVLGMATLMGPISLGAILIHRKDPIALPSLRHC